MVGMFVFCVRIHWAYSNQILISQGINQALEVAKTSDEWTILSIVSTIAVVMTFIAYKLAVSKHRDKIIENKELKRQNSKLWDINKRLQIRNKELQKEILAYLIRSASRN